MMRTLSMEAEDCRTDCRDADLPSNGASIVPPVARMLRHLLSPAHTPNALWVSARGAAPSQDLDARREHELPPGCAGTRVDPVASRPTMLMDMMRLANKLPRSVSHPWIDRRRAHMRRQCLPLAPRRCHSTSLPARCSSACQPGPCEMPHSTSLICLDMMAACLYVLHARSTAPKL